VHSQDPKTRNVRHILEQEPPSDTYDHLLNVSKSITRVLTSPESAVLLQDIYYTDKNLTSISQEEDLIGPNLFKNEESFYNYTKYESLVDAYLKLDIKKFFGYNLDEFLDLTVYARDILIEKANSELRAMDEASEEMRAELTQTLGLEDMLGIDSE